MNKLKRLISGAAIAAVAFGGLTISATTATAAGSDSPVPYTVDATGITLPTGQTFPDNGHVNVESNLGDKNIHFESQNDQPSGEWIGESFLPWSAFGYDTSKLCVSWVQIADFNEHFGEGGQEAVGAGCDAPPVETVKCDVTDPDFVAALENKTILSEDNGCFKIVAWQMPSWVDSATPTWSQTLVASEDQVDPDLTGLDATLQERGYGCYQVDIYWDTEITKNLLDGEFLDGPGNPTEDHLPKAGFDRSYKLVKVGDATDCNEPPVDICTSDWTKGSVSAAEFAAGDYTAYNADTCVQPTYEICSTDNGGQTWNPATVTEDQLNEGTRLWDAAADNGGCATPPEEIEKVLGAPPLKEAPSAQPVTTIERVLGAGPLKEAPAATAVVAEATFAG